MTQPESLRLADALATFHNPHDQQAAAELRRLHAELRRLQIDSDALGVHLSERMKDLFKVEAQREALLDALKEIVAAADGTGWDQLDASFSKARAAIAKSEEET